MNIIQYGVRQSNNLYIRLTNINHMETSKNNPILNFRIGNAKDGFEEVDEYDVIGGMTKNDGDMQKRSGGSFITLTREAVDSTESSG